MVREHVLAESRVTAAEFILAARENSVAAAKQKKPAFPEQARRSLDRARRRGNRSKWQWLELPSFRCPPMHSKPAGVLAAAPKWMAAGRRPATRQPEASGASANTESTRCFFPPLHGGVSK